MNIMNDPIIVGNNDFNKNKIPNYSTKIPTSYSNININKIGSIKSVKSNIRSSVLLPKSIGNSYGSYVSTPYPNKGKIATPNQNLTPLARAKAIGGSRKRKLSRRRSTRRNH